MALPDEQDGGPQCRNWYSGLRKSHETMSLTALLLVLLSAVNHASWNLVMKSSRDKYAFVWWMLAGGFLLTLPALFFLPVRFTPVSVALLAASIVAEGLYMLTLSASYQRLDYTVVYPVARGSAPVFIALGAAVLLGERVSPAGVAGILLISLGVLSLQRANLLRAHMRRLGLPLACGAWVASFSLANKAAVHYFSPLAMVCLIFGGTALLLWPYVVGVRRVDLVGEFRRQRLRVLVVALLSSAGFAAVLAAMRLAPVSYVGAARESSIILAALLGWLVLREGFGARRLLAAAVIFLGVLCLVLAR